MKRTKYLMPFLACAVLLLASCGKDDVNTATTIFSTAPSAKTGESTVTTQQDENDLFATTDSDVEVGKNVTNVKNDATLTGLKPMDEVTFKVTDPNNERGLSTRGIGYGFGVSKNGEPSSISVENQKYFDKYGALALDTKTKKKVLYLTFDCGYENGYTAKILDVLKEKNVKAAFFVTLAYLKSSQGQDIAARMINEGHIVGNHSSTHPVFPDISRTKMAQEIQNCDNYLRTKYGYTSKFFRFPTGEYSDCSLDLVQSIGYTSVFWSVAYVDYNVNSQPSNDQAFKTITSRLHPGAVILLHAVSSANTNVLGDVIDWAKEQGYTFAQLSDYKA